jgi:lipoprotein NlpI
VAGAGARRLHLVGEYTEPELVARVKEGDDDSNTQPNTSTDERLCEALFYVGESYWAHGDRDVARDYFAALVNIKVLYFLEHGLALAEIAKLR